MWNSAAGGIGFAMKTAATDSQGRFEFSGLWPGDEYHVAFEREGFDKQETASSPAVRARTHDFGRITLIAARGTVEGKIVDSSGKPVAGAGVQHRRWSANGERHQRLRRPLPPGGVALRAGLRFCRPARLSLHGGPRAAGATGLAVTILRKEQPAPRFSGPRSRRSWRIRQAGPRASGKNLGPVRPREASDCRGDHVPHRPGLAA